MMGDDREGGAMRPGDDLALDPNACQPLRHADTIISSGQSALLSWPSAVTAVKSVTCGRSCHATPVRMNINHLRELKIRPRKKKITRFGRLPAARPQRSQRKRPGTGGPERGKTGNNTHQNRHPGAVTALVGHLPRS